ncbi:MAG: hypothetical protein RJA70_4046 [Pseudomonadota bacterium]|jgi:nitrogen fixation/metabolism regulation signal transduction histidine kinase
MPHEQSASERPAGAHQRRLKNYLINPRFQLKYANMFAGIALVISAGLGALLWQASHQMIEQSREAVKLGEDVADESRKVSEVVAMNIVKDPVYSENPILKDAFEADARLQDKKLRDQQATLRAQSVRLSEKSAQFSVVLTSAILLLALALWCAGIWVTHKVAGPIYKMTKQIKAVEAGDLEVPCPLRKGDELGDFFEAFRHMVRSMRRRQHEEIEQLDSAIRQLSGSMTAEQLGALIQLRDRMRNSLGATEAPPPPV